MNYSNAYHHFSNRDRELDLLRRRVNDFKEGYRQNIALLGDQYIGKSTILRKFVYELDEHNILPIYLDLHHKDTHYFFYKFMTSLLYRFAQIKKLDLMNDLKYLSTVTYEFIPETVRSIEKIRALFELNKLPQAFRLLTTLPDIFYQETEIRTLLILDEFQAIEEYDIKDAFHDLGNQIMTQKHCLYVFASSYPEQATRIIRDQLSLLFGQFEVIHVDLFTPESAIGHIDRVLNEVRMGLQLKHFLADFTGGHPLYLNLILNELISLVAMHQQKEVYVPILSQAIENVVFNQWGTISRHFELTIQSAVQGKSSRVASALLIDLANDFNKAKKMSERLNIKQGVVTQRLNRFIDQNIVAKNGAYYYFKDKLLRYWVKYVYQRRLKDIELEMSRSYKLFKDDLNQTFMRFQIISRQQLSDRMADLFRCFNNETFDINGRKYRLPAFSNIEMNNLSSDTGRLDVIRAETASGRWLVALKKEPLSDADINCLMDQRKEMCSGSHKCVLVSLSDIDEQIKLRVLQEKIWLWRGQEVNQLMNFYNKPYVV